MDHIRPLDWTDLHWSVWCHDLDNVKELLATDSGNLNVQDNQGWTPLHLACCSAESKLWSLHQIDNRKLRHSQDPGKSLTTRPGAESRYPTLAYTLSWLASTPENFAEKNVSFMIALELLQAGADAKIKAQRFCTPLHCAASSGWVDHADALLYFGAPLYTEEECAPVCWTTHSGTDYRLVLEYFQKRLGPDSWRRIQRHGRCDGRSGGPLLDYNKPSEKFMDWYLKDLILNTSRGCLPGSGGVVIMEKVSPGRHCALCKAITVEKMCSPSGYLHAVSLLVLMELSKNCPNCKFFFQLFESRWLITTEDDISQVIIRAGNEAASSSKICALKLQLSSGCYCNDSRSLDLENCTGRCHMMLMEDIILDAFSTDERALNGRNFKYGKAPAAHGKSIETISSAKRWLSHCEINHSRCKKRSSTRPNCLPTRLLDVKDAQAGKLRLVLGQQLKSPYVALSHRWVSGPTPKWVTSKSNIEERRSSFEISVLPESIRDAVLFTSRLGLQYLWVDSVCIIQDSPDDWRSESVKMLDVYGNSTLTLFADSAIDDEDKFLKPRDTGNFQRRRGTSLIIGSSTGASVKIDLLERYSRYHAVLPARSSELFQIDVVTSGLSSRGWIFQEQVISSRRLYFGNHQMYWMCEEAFNAEDGSDLNVPYYFQWLFRPREGNDQPRPIRTSAQHRDWAALVENYSHRALSRSEDKLRALSGLAKLFSERYSDDYLTGSWKGCLQLDLLWVAKPPPSRGEEQVFDSALAWSKASGVPTWSWIAADGPVEYPHMRASILSSEIKIQYEILQVPEINYYDDEIFATLPVSHGPLQLRGIVERASCLGELQDIRTDPNLPPPWYRSSKDFFGHTMKLYDSGWDDLQPIGWMITDRLCEELVRPLELLLLSAWELTGTCSGCGTKASRYRYFIVLDAVEGRVDVVRRVGFGWTYNRVEHKRGGHYDEDKVYQKRWRSLAEVFHII